MKRINIKEGIGLLVFGFGIATVSTMIKATDPIGPMPYRNLDTPCPFY